MLCLIVYEVCAQDDESRKRQKIEVNDERWRIVINKLL